MTKRPLAKRETFAEGKMLLWGPPSLQDIDFKDFRLQIIKVNRLYEGGRSWEYIYIIAVNLYYNFFCVKYWTDVDKHICIFLLHCYL